jgi:hypothetical protein
MPETCKTCNWGKVVLRKDAQEEQQIVYEGLRISPCEDRQAKPAQDYKTANVLA